MRASKEECHIAIQNVKELMFDLAHTSRDLERFSHVQEFLDVAVKRLPSEAAYDRDLNRRKKEATP